MPLQTLSTVRVLEDRQRSCRVKCVPGTTACRVLRMGMRETPVATEGTRKGEHSQQEAVHTWRFGRVMSPPQ